MKRHHKFLIGGFSSIIIIFIIASGILTYTLFVRLEINTNQLSDQISELQQDTQSKFNELSENLLQSNKDVTALQLELGSIDEEFDVLKASVGEGFEGIVEDAIKSVVTIRTDVSQGTGFVIDGEGYIVTNAHVMEGAKAAGVFTYFDDEAYPVSLIGSNTEMDVSLLKVEGNFEKLEFANSNNIQVGEKVVAIGNPLGLQFSVSEGIVSALNRPGANGLEAYIQTDAALNPGNSGGPLIDKEGKVIGINNFKVGGGESLGFALESNYLRDTINQIALDSGLNETLV